MFFQLKGMKKAGSRWREYSFMLFLCRCFLGAHRETSGRIEIGLKMVDWIKNGFYNFVRFYLENSLG